MKFYYTLTFILLFAFAPIMNAQTGESVSDAIPVDFSASNTVTFNNVDTRNSAGNALGVLGACAPTDIFPTFVYKVTTPQEGALHIQNDNYVTSAGFIFSYDGAANASSNSDLTFREAAGNTCTFSDSMFLGRGYLRWNMAQVWQDPASFNPGSSPVSSYSIPAGTYYILFCNYNTSNGTGAASNLTFEFTPYCTGTLPDIAAEGQSTNITDGDNTPSTSDDTDYGVTTSGAAAISKTFTIKNTDPTTTLNISNVSITGTNAANFSVTTSPSSTVAGNSSTTMIVQFTPNTIGENTATIEITSDDCDEQIFNFDVKSFVAATTPSDKRGNMMTLDGSDDYVEINNVATPMDGVTEFTLEAWFNADATQAGNDRIISINSSSGGNVFLLYVQDGVIKTFDGSDDDAYGSDLRGTGWHHVAVAHDNSRDYVYLDGVSLGDGAASVSAFASNNQWSIGQEFDGGSTGDFFKGSFDEVRIWKDVRTEEEIKTNMNLTFSTSQVASLENLVAYYQFDNDDATGTVDGVKDILGNHGTVKNGGIYNASEVAVGNGTSEKQTVNAAGTFDFSTVGVELTFSGGTVPNGDIVITKIITEVPKNVSAGELTNKPTTYWVIRNLGANNSGLSCDIKFKFDDGEIDDNLTANHKIHKRGSNDFDAVDWSDLVPNSVSNTSGDNHITVNVTSFSQFGASSSSSDFVANLPVELISFNGYPTTKGSHLAWQTASEKNNEGFEIQRSTNARDWENIGFVLGKGTTQESQDYQFVDEQPKAGVNYYRLKQIDLDGQYDYSNLVNVEFQSKETKLQVYPNPVKDELNIIGGQGNATIYNILGQPVRQFVIQNEQIRMNVSDLSSGQYILHIQQRNGHVITKRFMK